MGNLIRNGIGASSRKRSFATIALILIVVLVLVPAIYPLGSRSYKEVTISAGGYQLAGTISEGIDPDGTWIIFTHGNRKSATAHPLYQAILRSFDDRLSILALDFRGYGASSAEGMPTAEHVLDRTDDIEAATTYLERSYGIRRQDIVLIGHSLGALQVLKAGQDDRYRSIIALGPANFEAFLDNGPRMQRYIQKFKGNTGVEMTEEKMLREGSTLTPASLFSPCPLSPVTLVFGSRDHDDVLLHDRPMIDSLCTNNVKWVVIPAADHMYGAEIFGFAKPIQTLDFLVLESLLTKQLDQILS